MIDDMGIFRTTIDVAHPSQPDERRTLAGFAWLFAAGRSAIGAVVFAEPKDLVLLGAHGLEGLNLRVDLGRKELVPAGPVPAAAA